MDYLWKTEDVTDPETQAYWRERYRDVVRQLHSLLEDKHSALARNKNLEDLMAALKGENDSLKDSLRLTGGATVPTRDNKSAAKSYEAQLEELTWQLRNSQAELQQKQRADRLYDSEMQSLKSQLRAKETSLDEALSELERSANSHEDDMNDRKQQKIDKLNAEIRGLHAEVKLWHDKYESLSVEKKQLEDKVDLVQKSKSRPLLSSRGTSDSSNQEYESELNEKDTQIMKLTVQYNEVENQLQRAKQTLLLEQENSTEVSTQLDDLLTQLRQKQRLIDKMCSSEHDHQVEVSAIRDSLAANNRELTQKTSELKRLAVELSGEREKVLKLQRDMASRDSVINRGLREAIQEGRIGSLPADPQSARESLTEAEQKARMMQYERDNLQNHVSKLSEQMEFIVSENAELVNKVRQVKQELIKERATVCQLTTEKVDSEQKLKICMEERDSLQKENNRMARDLTKHELNTKETLQKLEMEAMKAHVEYEDRNKNLSVEGKRIAYELESCRRLLEGRDKEINLLQDNLNRYKQDVDALNRKNSMLKEEIQANRDDIEKLTSELSIKMKENVTSVEVQQLLGNERNKAEVEKQHVQRDLSKERDTVKKCMMEVNNLHSKLAKAEENLRQSLHESHEKQNQFVVMETELRHVNRSLEHTQAERAQLKQQVDELNAELRRTNSTNASLQRQIDLENKSLHRHVDKLAEEKTVHSQLRDNLESTSRQMSQTKQEYEILKASLETERRTVQQLKEQCQGEEERSYQLLDQMHSLEVEVNTLQGQLAASKESLEDSRRTKQSLYNDLQDLCKKLSEKDEIITKLQEKCNETVDVIQREFAMEKSHIARDKESVEDELKRTKQEVNELNEKLKHKDLQLETVEHNLRDLDNASRLSQELEVKVQSMEAEVKDARLSIGNLKTENEALSKANKKLQESVERLTQTNDSLKEQFRSQKDSTSIEVMEVKQKMADQASRYELERSDLKDRFNKVIANLKATEVSLAAVTETKEHLYESNKKFERTVDTIKSQLHEEITVRKLAEQKVDSLKTQVDELRQKRTKYDDRLSEMQTTLAKTEAELILEREKVRKFVEEHNDTENIARTHETRAQVLTSQVNDLQEENKAMNESLQSTVAEVTTLKEQLNNQKEHLSGKNKRVSHEIKQQAGVFEKERSKLAQQLQQLERDLDQAREQLAAKNKDNLKMHEEILNAEEKMREANRELKQAQDALKMESQLKEQLERRNQEVEDDLMRLRNAMKGDFDPSALDTTKAEMSKMMQDMQKQMQKHLDSQRNSEKEGKVRESKSIEELKKRIYELESQLNQEQAINIVIKTQLQSLEDENQRLRLQLQAAKRRQDRSRERSTKTRMEEINEIIAKSQARAQQMLSSGAYNEEALRTVNLPNSGFPFMPLTGTFGSTVNRHSMSSPEPRSHASDDFNHSFNGSLINGVSGFSEHLNNQSTLPLGSPRELRHLTRTDKTSTP